MKKLNICLLLCLLLVVACKKDENMTVGGTPVDSEEMHVPNIQLYGVAFGPYSGEGEDPTKGTVLTVEQIRERLEIIKNYTLYIRTFGTSNTEKEIPRIAKEMGFKVYASAWLSSDLDSNEEQIKNLIEIGRQGYADALIVGSEVLLRGELSPQQLAEYINRVRIAVPALPVSTADVFDKLIEFPEVRNECSFLFPNIYPFWMGEQIQCGIYRLHKAYSELEAVANGKEIIISETGWPSGGQRIDLANPTPLNACKYLNNVLVWSEAMGVKTFIFSALQEPWKVEQEGEVGEFWGLFDKNGSLPSCMETIFDGELEQKFPECTAFNNSSLSPVITFTQVPEYGSNENLKGSVGGVRPEEYKVVVLIKVLGNWYIKPYSNQRKNPIGIDGSWGVDITTGGSDRNARAIGAWLIPTNYDVPNIFSVSTVPAELEQNAVARVIMERNP